MTIAERVMAREKGVVKWFSTEKGYGFIRREGGDEIFVHHTDIEVDGYASLKNGETVEFDVFESDRGPKARNLVPLDVAGASPAPGARAGERGARAETRSRGGAGGRKRRSGSSSESDRSTKGSQGPTDRAEVKRSLAVQLRERLGGRFPGFGG
jgi:CspA family cold shock protein